MARLIIENLTTEQAKELANWYEGQGEQDAYDWFDVRDAGPCPMANVQKLGGCITIDDIGNIYLYTK